MSTRISWHSTTWAKCFVWAAAVFGFLVTYYAYYPGIMSADSNDQLQQAQTGHFVDWHPPIMAWLWSLTNAVIPGPGGFFLILTGLYWIGFCLVSLYFLHRGSRRYIVVLALPFLPFFINFAGTMWKDTLVFGCFLTFTGIAMLRASGRRIPAIVSLVAWCLLIVGCLARYNSGLAAVPLAALYLWPELSTRRPWWSLARRLTLSAMIVAALALVTEQLLDRFVFHAEKSGPLNSLLLWDIVGISQRVGTNLVPGNWSEIQAHDLATRCYNPQQWNNLGGPDPNDCSFAEKELKQSGLWQRGLLGAWVNAVRTHPEDYLLVRLSYARTLLWPNNVFDFEPEAASWKYGLHANMLFLLIKNTLMLCKTTPVIQRMFGLAFWLGATGIMCLVSFRNVLRNPADSYLEFLIALSGAFYVWPLLLIGVSGDLRYGYWSIATVCISILLLAMGIPAGASEMSDKPEIGRTKATAV